MSSALMRLGIYIRTKGNFIRASIIGAGGLFGVFTGVLFFDQFGPGAFVLAFLIAPVFGWIWGIAMWHLWYMPLQASLARRRTEPGSAHERDDAA